MAKSYKKHPYCCDRNPYMKNQANRKIRYSKINDEIPNGKVYKKYFNPWKICDWKTYKPFYQWQKIAYESIIKDLSQKNTCTGFRIIKNHWEKWFKRK